MEFFKTLFDIGDKKKHAGRILNKSGYDVIQIHLKQGEIIKEHHAKEETLIIVREGQVQFTVEGEVFHLTNETILQMDPYEKHDLKAIEETDLVLIKIR